MADAITVLTAIGITVLMLLMVISGAAMIVKELNPNDIFTMQSLKFNRAVTILKYIGLFIYIPGTIILYATYVKSLLMKN
ncbi:imv protein vp13 [Raccoonpox virus]|uniref:Protein OPG081 n=2 Tax=Orthopoxvirus TaxID=10242 RepID=A0A0G3FXN3_RACVI|nr:IMV protein VP13 [Raccoonpox virus]YP_009282767.1 imv protein vp13 [Skunkpox virus]AKJ93703.1 IMV protein VP13 [Raccoonpox virus]AOP31335.1 imv protein vp13 [Raccoonpox virus]AOP31552.1 imv protein vp13 [Skunkpox virus]